jgi:hypothetical protein
MLLADLLLSGPERPGSQTVIPTTEDLSSIFPSGSTKVPRGVRQKIAVVTDKLVVGWAGEMRIARDVVAELIRRSQSAPFTRQSLGQYFNGLGDAVWKKFGIVGFIEDDVGMTSFCCDHTHEFSTPLLGKVALLGSGAKSVKEMLGGISQMPQTIDGSPTSSISRSALDCNCRGSSLTSRWRLSRT